MNKGGFSFVSDGVWKKGRQIWVEAICPRCEETYLRRKDRKQQVYCSRNCFLDRKDENNEIVLSEIEKEVIDGILLSDGSIISSGSKNYSFSMTTTEEGFSDFVSEFLSFPIGKCVMKERVRRLNGKDYLCRQQIQIRSRSSITFTKMRRTWYPSGQKVVPDGIRLSALSVLMWYLGDGHLDNSRGAILCTDSFTGEDTERLCGLLSDVGISGGTTKKGRILIPNRNVFEFFEFIGWNPPVMGYAHKWDTIVKKSYQGRRCRGCDSVFDVEVNHQYWCSDACYRRDWKRRQRKLKTTQHKVGD